jgi:hypothetical protein
MEKFKMTLEHLENLKALKRWEMPDSYFGAEWPEYFVFLSQARDSDALTRSNFECGLEALEGESETVIVVRERHWAVGWVEWIAIHESDVRSIIRAEGMLCALSDYPVLDESHFSELEWAEAESQWEMMPLKYRVELCAEADVSIFAARRDSIPSEDSGYIFERLTGY